MNIPKIDMRTPRLILITGPSGSGKSQTLASLKSKLGTSDIATGTPAFRDTVLLQQWPGIGATDAAKRLTRVGLADAFTWARTPAELSVGQRDRLAVAYHAADPAKWIIADEWLAHLDRHTAKAVAWTTGAALRTAGRGAIFVTAHSDLAADLMPDVHIRVGWTPDPEVIEAGSTRSSCSLLRDLRIEQGDRADWLAVKHLHYAAGDPATIHSVWRAMLPDMRHPAAVVVYSYPDLHSMPRNVATRDAYKITGDREVAKKLNREMLKLSRLVVTPELRGIGIARELITATAAQLGKKYIECVTAIGKHSKFLLRCGFNEVPQAESEQETELRAWASRAMIPPHATIDADALRSAINALSVRQAREAFRVIWNHYHHLVLYRRTRTKRPGRIAHHTDPRWPEAFDLAARRLTERPAYFLLGPIDPMTGEPDPVS